jgi:hypothetical protein
VVAAPFTKEEPPPKGLDCSEKLTTYGKVGFAVSVVAVQYPSDPWFPPVLTF